MTPNWKRRFRRSKKDYPEDEFEQMLLESAIPFALWRDRLRVRLLMEKVVDRELVQPVEITHRILKRTTAPMKKTWPPMMKKPPDMDLNRYIVEQIRREKVEAAYPQWMDGLRKQYAVEINWELWEQPQRPGSGSSSQGKE
jgi:hypothetical protein